MTATGTVREDRPMLRLKNYPLFSVIQVLPDASMRKSAIAKLAENLNDIPLLFPPLKHIVFEAASLCGFVYLMVQLWKHL
jgi:hypothetical protein